MSTNDVPGANPANGDELKVGCWAEHDDGSLIFVAGCEGGRVVYSVFDMSKDPPIEYRDTMAEKAFKDTYSRGRGADVWTWHDKTPFPWDRIVDAGIQQGPGYPSAEHLMTAAERVAQSRALHGRDMDRSEYAHMSPREVGQSMINRIQEWINRLPR